MKHEPKKCSRCGIIFECKVGDVANCQCNLPLQKETIDFLRQNYNDCLCANCLKHFDDLVTLSKNYKFPKKQEEFIEGVHFYMEGHFLVFTELYHFLRGYCCRNGCRHCVYGFKKNS
ncbi:MAG: cysteine-rich CWC family protein [Leptospiraceae bacterium]|nr:cysteine-rich CWC family protein [Leptospiraceae bacterium]